MKVKSLHIICLMLLLFVVIQESAGKTNILDMIIQQKLDPYEYIKSEDYIRKRELIREELFDKYRLMITMKQYDNFFEYLIFAIDIADKRYIKLLHTIEQDVHSLGGENIMGYSKLIKAKTSGVSSETIIDEIVNDKMGSFLLADVFAYLMSSNTTFDNKLIVFKKVSTKVKYKYHHVIYGTLESLCDENRERTSSFLENNSELRKHLEYDCNTIKQGP